MLSENIMYIIAYHKNKAYLVYALSTIWAITLVKIEYTSMPDTYAKLHVMV